MLERTHEFGCRRGTGGPQCKVERDSHVGSPSRVIGLLVSHRIFGKTERGCGAERDTSLNRFGYDVFRSSVLADHLRHDLTVDDACSTLRVTAEMFERSAAATDDSEKREALLHYAKCYREMAELRDQSDAEMDDESA